MQDIDFSIMSSIQLATFSTQSFDEVKFVTNLNA